MGMTSAMSIPLIAHGRLLGSLSFARSQPDRHYGLADLVLAEELVVGHTDVDGLVVPPSGGWPMPTA